MPQGSLDAAILLISLWFCRWRSWPWVDPERDTHTSNGTYRITLLHLPLDSPDLTALGMWRSWLCYRSRPIKITWLWITKDHQENLLPAVVLAVFKHKWWCKNSPVERMLLLHKSLLLVLRAPWRILRTNRTRKVQARDCFFHNMLCYYQDANGILFCIIYAYFVAHGSWELWRACSTPKRCGQYGTFRVFAEACSWSLC